MTGQLDHLSPEVSAVIVTWNSQATLAPLIASLRRQAGETALDVTFIDNASTDSTVEIIRRLAPEARLVVNSINRGLSAANNQGLLATRAPFLVVCNPDIEPAPGAFRALLDVLQRRPTAGIAIPRIVLPDGRRHVSVGSVPNVLTALLGRRAGRVLSRGSAPSQDLWWDDWPHDTETRVPRGAESCYLVRRSAIAEVGLQDERFPLDWEGVDWAARFGKAGWEIWFTPGALVVHEGGASIRQAQLRWVVQSHRGLRQYCLKRSPPWARPAVTLAVAVRGGVKAAAVLAGRDTYAQAQSVMDGSHD